LIFYYKSFVGMFFFDLLARMIQFHLLKMQSLIIPRLYNDFIFLCGQETV